MLGTLGDRLSLGDVNVEFAALLVGVDAFTLPPVDMPTFSFVSFCSEVTTASSHNSLQMSQESCQVILPELQVLDLLC